MKSYTDLEQSKKLEKILSSKSADMAYDWFIVGEKYSTIPQCRKFIDDELPCWSLMALFNVIPKHIRGCNILRIDIGEEDFSIWYDEIEWYGVNTELPDITKASAVDACVEMILKLHKRKLL